MNKTAASMALVALLGVSTTATAAFAQFTPHNRVNCSDPRVAGSPFCLPGSNNDASQSPGGRNHNHNPNDGGGDNADNGGSAGAPQGSPPQDFHRNHNFNGNGDSSPDMPQGGPPPNFDPNGDAPGGNGSNFGDGQRGGPDHPGFPRHPHDDPGQFRHLFHGFGFGFEQPYFDIQPGMVVPHSYRLRQVPWQIYRDYPEYRGFLFFVTRDGSIVIVSPRSHRIVDII